jgi:hypothetical protein
MDGQYDYIKISTPELMGDFMTKDLDRNYEHFTIESRGFLAKNVLKKDGQIFKFNGVLTIYSHQGEYTMWIRDGLVVDMITSYRKEDVKEPTKDIALEYSFNTIPTNTVFKVDPKESFIQMCDRMIEESEKNSLKNNDTKIQ